MTDDSNVTQSLTDSNTTKLIYTTSQDSPELARSGSCDQILILHPVNYFCNACSEALDSFCVCLNVILF